MTDNRKIVVECKTCGYDLAEQNSGGWLALAIHEHRAAGHDVRPVEPQREDK